MRRKVVSEIVYRIIVDSADASQDVLVDSAIINILYDDGIVWKTDKPGEYKFDGDRYRLMHMVRILSDYQLAVRFMDETGQTYYADLSRILPCQVGLSDHVIFKKIHGVAMDLALAGF